MRVFLETLRSGSVSGAAERCNMSQPAATQAIGKLEAVVGAQLVLRLPRTITPTPSGALFRGRVERALDHLRVGALEARRISGHKPLQKSDFSRNVTPAQIRALIAVAGSGSFTVAARRLALSQPSVHRAARHLEEIAGVPLFRTTAVGVDLTAGAQVLALRAKLAQAEIRQGFEEIGTALGRDRATFALGSLPLARTAIVPRATHAMICQTPGFQVQVVDGRYDALLRSLREGDLDCLIGALRSPAPADDVTQERLFDDALAIVAHASHPLAQSKDVTLEATMAFPWVAPPKQTPAGRYLFDTLRIGTRDQTPVRVVSSSLVMLRGILAQGPYVSIISRHQISIEEAHGDIVPLPVRLAGNLRAIGLTYRRDWRPTDTQARYLDLLRGASRDSACGAVSDHAAQ